MSSVITSIYNKKTKGRTLMEMFTATGKLNKSFFGQLETFDVCTTGDSTHRLRNSSSWHKRITAAVKDIEAPMLTRVWQKLEYRNRCVPSPVVQTSNVSSCQKKNLFSFPVAVNNSIKVGPLVFLL
jgi:hypothetical protein